MSISLTAPGGDASLNDRFYPESIPPFPYEPTKDRFQIRYDAAFGEGVISLVPFKKGEIIFAFTGFFVSEVTQFSLQIAEGLHLHDPYFYGKILHSCEPNARVDLQQRLFIAVAPIKPGDCITMDYASTEDYLYKTFPCSCAASNCRKLVAGRKQHPIPTSMEPGLPTSLVGEQSHLS